MSTAHAYAAQAADQPLAPFVFERRAPGPNDVHIDIAYCGVCHSDLHTARNEWHNTVYPSVPGHEIVGRVSAVGNAVTGFKVGDLAGVGCMVDSCRSCASCQEGEEQYCEQGFTGTYNGPMFGGGENTYGGYSDHIVVDQKYVLRITHSDNLAAVAPLLCAGITTYSPLAHWKVGPGQKVGVVGLGGLGHMAVKIAKAMGATVVLFTTSESKRADALRLGASEVVISKDEAQMAAQHNTLDFILNTVAAPHNLDPFLNALKRDGAMVLVGVPEQSHPSPAVFNLVMKRRTLAGSLIGGIRQTQEMLDFCAKHNIVSDIETIRADQINEAYERMLKSDVKYRFVIDMASLDKAA
ncbi:TPA: NAD(P)-dependent alcohol dehydrogenase [Xanthomonas vasicola pv. zeae]|uniref:Hydroxyacid dehydrogenase n=2 Tax=Xanthomonas vasicola pv. vasculorum TaxID=325776 RepID=A0A836P4Y8_XANVA|nr:NAD(P)-dependent alcohol dehydrogenase [Xanthomonas vasicola]KFA39767.1 hydroxyacid dehydrogenase [Xanthomonas vasicola pv. musacearum NCPPB 4384]AVQ05314.1 NAD(P)-dependent alcohol dehydrogenase [Xanthomonas vasicola pv. vasculorum]AZM69509.1 NAD(P)-dependent alcohol dehydrogenase [Xanthomonas vasicola pv. vasculorum]AZR29218.1 NAD(P)-dependent alcohol dehydrogenase [Xanthomonas vasicola pv. musacearum NCPPB 4379]KEZ98636.1 hydroxyacid dehydrogenase [Xanthomonas vasicola pv. vasculorum NCP